MAIGNEVISQTLCDACGAEVRSGSLFCYGCGGEVKSHDSIKQGASQKDSNPVAETLGSNGSSADAADESIIDSTSVPRQSTRVRKPEPENIKVTWQRADRPGYWLLIFAAIVAAVVLLMLAAVSYLK